MYGEKTLIHAFTLRGKNYVLDVESGTILMPDPLSFKVLLALEKGEDVNLLSIEKEILDSILAEIKELKKAGMLFTPAPNIEEKREYGLKALCLNMAHDCNLRCTYCFGDKGAFGGERKKMSVDIAKRALLMLAQKSGKRKNLEVDFFGGEPLINFEAVKEAVVYGRQLEKEYDKNFRFTITTNAYSFPEEYMDFLNKEMKNVVISVDGRKQTHDRLRKTVSGGGSYDKVIENAMKFVKKRGEGEHYIRGTFTSNNLDFSADVTDLVDKGFKQISIEPVVTVGSLAITKEMLPQIMDEYEKLFDLLREYKDTEKWFNFFHFMIDLDAGPCLNKRIRGCGAGREYVAISPDGDIYPCHQFVGKSEFLMGNIFYGIIDKDIAKKFSSVNVFEKEDCSKCFAKYYCSGGCAANSYNITGDLKKNVDISCEMERKRVELSIALALDK
ncbi:MAG: thioether cross-link-forming SCIFF peptide maturase [Eubacteriales bacterium]